MKKEKFTVYRDGLKICGIAYLTESTDAAIIMSHGYLSNLSNFTYFAERFCDLSYNVFTFNFCCGSDETNPELLSDGDSRDMCIEDEIADLSAVYEYVCSRPYVKNDEIYLLGESQGALVSGLVAAKLQEKIKKLIMIFPAVCIPDHARRGVLGGANYDPKNPPEEMQTERAVIGRKFHDGVKDMDVYSELAKYKGKTLLIQGTEDSIVVPQYQYIVKDEFDKTDENDEHRMSLQMVRGMDHWTGGEHKEGICESVRFFLEDKEEILTFRIIVTRVVPLDDNDKLANIDSGVTDNGAPADTDIIKPSRIHAQDVYFTGYCESDLYTGAIISGVDHQKYKGSECLEMNAEYEFEGVDTDGQYCKMGVRNIKRDGIWKPRIKVNSEALSWLNDADLSAIVENGQSGPTIRVYRSLK